MFLRKFLPVFILVLSALSLKAQFGVSARLQNNSNSTWTNTYQSVADTSQTLLNRSYEFGINYWFRMKNYRLEFLPELTLATAKSDRLFSGLDVLSHERRSYNFNLNVQLYPLDFFGDCNCPTFSKDGQTFSKGFYWLLSPGLSYHSLRTEMDPASSIVVEDASMTSFRIGLGAGVDFGLTNMITMSPFIQYSMNFGNAWPEQYLAYGLSNPENNTNSSNINQWHFGIRMIFRPDYKF